DIAADAIGVMYWSAKGILINIRWLPSFRARPKIKSVCGRMFAHTEFPDKPDAVPIALQYHRIGLLKCVGRKVGAEIIDIMFGHVLTRKDACPAYRADRRGN